MSKNFKYDAFISYRHLQPDGFVAKNLHKQLESFKIPGKLKRKLLAENEEARTKITRVFRDEEELPLASNLADPITEALNDSDYLIVICSPRLKESMWCKKEIETFLQIRDSAHILCVLVEGEPSDSFPEELLYREKEVELEDGTITKIKEPVEPLAADVRGESDKERLKKIKSEILRLAAPMFGVSFDDLRQRHREAKLRRIITGVSIAAGICLAFGAVSTTMALRIQSQNVQIQEQSEEITQQRDEIAYQYGVSLRKNAESAAKTAESLFEQGDRIGAIRVASEVFPQSESDERPFVPSVSRILTSAMHVYDVGRYMYPDVLLETDSEASFMRLSRGANYLCVLDDTPQILTYDVQSLVEVSSILLEDNYAPSEENFSFIDDTHVALVDDKVVKAYDIVSGECLYSYETGYARAVYANENNLVVYGSDELFVLDAITGTLKTQFSYPDESGYTFGSDILEDKYILLVLDKGEEGKPATLYDLERMEPVWTLQNDMEYAKVARVFDGELFFATNASADWDLNLLSTQGMHSKFYCLDLLTGEEKWSFDYEDGWLYRMVKTGDTEPYVLVSTYDGVLVLNPETGEEVSSFYFNSEIKELFGVKNSDIAIVLTRDGSWVNLALSYMESILSNNLPEPTSDNLKGFTMGGGHVYTLPYSSNNVTVYSALISENTKELCDFGDSVEAVAVDETTGNFAVSDFGLATGNRVAMYEGETGTLLWEQETDELLHAMTFANVNGKDTLILLEFGQVVCLDAESGLEMGRFEIDYMDEFLNFSADGKTLITKATHGLNAYDLETGELIGSVTGTPFEQVRAKTIACLSDDLEYLCVTNAQAQALETYKVDLRNATEEVNVDSLTPVSTLQEQVGYMNALFFDPSRKALVVIRKYGQADVYSVSSDGKLVEDSLFEAGEVDKDVTGMRMLSDKEGILYGKFTAYTFTTAENGPDIAPDVAHLQINGVIDNYRGAYLKGRKAILTGNSEIYVAPIYNHDLIREEIEKILQ